jgi:hypothetical protein
MDSRPMKWQAAFENQKKLSGGLWSHFLGNFSRLEEVGQYLDKGVQCWQVLKSLLALPKG